MRGNRENVDGQRYYYFVFLLLKIQFKKSIIIIESIYSALTKFYVPFS